MAEEPSTSIDEISYDEARQQLTVTFTGGQTFIHLGVPSGIYAAFVAAGHRGSFYAERIRDSYRRA